MKIYSPSRGGTQDFQRCPRLWDLKKRWVAPEPFNVQVAMGNALHKGLEAWYGTWPNKPYSYAELELIMQYPADYAGEWPLEKTLPILKYALEEALEVDLLGKTGKVLAVEQEMGPEQCHPDLVIQHTDIKPGEGIPCDDPKTFDMEAYRRSKSWLQVVDWKFSLHLKPEWMAKRLASYETLWQLWHYAWRAQQEFNLPCKEITVVQVAGLPQPRARQATFEVTHAKLERWHESALWWWGEMEMRELYPKVTPGDAAPANYEGCRKYGEDRLCPMYHGCHVLAADESKFDTLYTRREP